METFNPIFPICGRTALLIVTLLMVPMAGGASPVEGQGLADKELSHRNAAVEEARELLRKGDQAYQAGRYADAIEAYAGACELLPNAPVSAELRAAATERHAQASVAQARFLSRKGDVAAAKKTVDKALDENLAPDDPGALVLRAQLDDPIRTNPTLTLEHAKDVDQVRRLLYTAEGAFTLGKYDESKSHYEAVLRIDPTNTAARRGMEQVAAAKSGYQKSSYDHTRAELLSQVDAEWELHQPVPNLDVGSQASDAAATSSESVAIAARLKQIIIPKIALDQATLDEAIDFLRTASRQVDLTGTNTESINFTINLGQADSETAKRIGNQKFDLRLTQVPLSQVLKYITDLTRTSYTTDGYSVIITPAGSTSNELLARSYRVPPDFITSLSAGAGAATEEKDPFANASPREGLLTKRLSAKQALEKQGISFPEGASAGYDATSCTLRVVNTEINQSFISQLVETMTQTEPVMVAVRVTMIKTSKTNLEELGFDWLVNPFGLSANNMYASGGTVGSTPGRNGSDFITPVGGVSVDGVPATPDGVARNLVTNGLRSGSHAINGNTLDNLINNPDRSSQENSVAPGIMAITGLFSDGQVQMIMRGLDQKGGVDIMSRPSTVTRSGEASTVDIIREFIYPTEYEPPELPNNGGGGNNGNGGIFNGGGGGNNMVTPATPTAFEKKDIGISLEVLPVADATRRYVDITLNPQFTNFEGFVNYGSPINTTSVGLLGEPQTMQLTENQILMPVFGSQRVKTQLTVADGCTIAIGGLMTETVQNVEDAVPVFGSLPVVGRLFSSKSKQTVTNAIVFLVQVELLDPIGRPYRDR